MKKSFRTAMVAFTAFAAALCLVPQPVKAEETTAALNEASVTLDDLMKTDSVGNVYFTGDSMTFDNKSSEKDFYMAGNDCKISNSDITQDALVAGNTLSFNNVNVGGSMRAAGYSIAINDVKVKNNITAAASSISVGPETTSDAAVLAAGSVSFDGTCGDLKIFAGNVTVNGTVTGDALICADKVTIAESAVINGNLRVESGKEPVISDSATVNSLDYEKVVEVDDDVEENISMGARIAHKLLSRVYWIPAIVLIAFIFCLVLGKALNGSSEMLLKKPAVMLGSGAVTLIALPVALILLCITYIGLPLAVLLTLLMLPVMFFAVTFTGASVGRIVFKTMHPWLASIIGTAILVFVRIIPIIGGLVLFVSLIYALGYLIQICYAEIKTSNKKKQPAAQVEAAQDTTDIQ